MRTEPAKAFVRDIEKIIDPTIRDRIDRIIKAVENACRPGDIPHLRKLRGFRNGIWYRIRVGDYRIGVTIVGDLVTFDRYLPKKDFYGDYPPK